MRLYLNIEDDEEGTKNNNNKKKSFSLCLHAMLDALTCFDIHHTTLNHATRIYPGKEPPFTNYAFTARDEQAFVDTLDYFFMSPGVAAVEVGDLPESTDAIPGTSLPSADEPSDHLLVSAVFEIDGAAAAGDNDGSTL